MNGLFNTILDTTMPPNNSMSWVWGWGIILGEVLACLILTLGIRYLSSKKIRWSDAFFMATLATASSFGFGVVWWFLTGFWG